MEIVGKLTLTADKSRISDFRRKGVEYETSIKVAIDRLIYELPAPDKANFRIHGYFHGILGTFPHRLRQP